jgi:error-prone DNA polymerase
MAAWKRKGGVHKFHDRMIGGMREPTATRAVCRAASSSRSSASANTAFPESHAASFALLVYVSSWLKHHEPAAFLAAMLNSQPLGFYTPVAAGAGRAAPRRAGAPGRRDVQRLGLHAGRREMG